MKKIQYAMRIGKSIPVIYLEIPEGMIPPPTITLYRTPNEYVFHYAPDQQTIAKLWNLTQQTVSRYMKNAKT